RMPSRARSLSMSSLAIGVGDRLRQARQRRCLVQPRITLEKAGGGGSLHTRPPQAPTSPATQQLSPPPPRPPLNPSPPQRIDDSQQMRPKQRFLRALTDYRGA